MKESESIILPDEKLKKKKEEPNRPYKKVYDAAGELLNPIKGSYPNTGPNRKDRRLVSGLTSTRPFSNKKGPQIFTITLGAGLKKRVFKLIRKVTQKPGRTYVQTIQKEISK